MKWAKLVDGVMWVTLIEVVKGVEFMKRVEWD